MKAWSKQIAKNVHVFKKTNIILRRTTRNGAFENFVKNS